MDSVLISGVAAAGLVVGGVLDPVGQRIADRSRAGSDGRLATTSECGHTTTFHLLPDGPSPARTIGAAITTSVLFAAVASKFGRDAIIAPFCVLVALLVVVAVTDLSHRMVPRRVLYPGLALIVPLLLVTSAVDDSWRHLVGAGIGGAAVFCVLFAIWWIAPRGLGFGDVRLGGVVGLSVGYLSLLHAYMALLAGFLIGALFGLVMMGTASVGRTAPEGGTASVGTSTRIPFAPALAAGAVIAVLWGGPMARGFFGST